MSTPNSDIVERLAGVVATARRDLEVTRDIFQDEPTYILRDPLANKSTRMGPDDYEIFCRLDDETPLSEVFDRLLDEGRIARDEEESFYDFVIELHRGGLLNLPISDDRALYDRYRRRRLADLKQKIVGFLFLKVPMFSPDRFLDRTRFVAQFLFSRGVFFLWLVGLVTAGSILFARRDDLENPISAIVDADGAVGLILALVGLKVIHEFGHAWACKLYGGRVPVMGAMFVVFTPLAFVDASSAWGFENKRQRIIVNLAGMYFESIIAILAVFVWANTGPGHLNSLAYQVMLLASVVTIAFNANPLMRFDGYYVLADWLGIPNLRERATRCVTNVFDRVVLGLPRPASAPRWSTRGVLFGYGISSAIYKVTLVLGICTMIAMRSFYVGIALAGFYLAQTLIGSLGKVTRHLYFSPATAPARFRAATLGAFVLIGLPVLAALAPVSLPRGSTGIVEYERETAVRVTRPGFLVAPPPSGGAEVEAECSVARVVDPTIGHRLAAAEAEVAASRVKVDVERFREPARSAAERVRLEGLIAAADAERKAQTETEIRTTTAGRLIPTLDRDDVGQWLEAGAEVGRVVAGDRVVRFLFDSETLEEAALEAGDTLPCRALAQPDREWDGTVLSVAPAASRTVAEESLTQFGGGEIVVDPETGTATSPFVEVFVRLPVEAELARGLGVEARVYSARRPLSAHLIRAVVRFADEIRTH